MITITQHRGFFIYPSRHRQVAKDLVYIEDRKSWQIIEDALEEYVVCTTVKSISGESFS